MLDYDDGVPFADRGLPLYRGSLLGDGAVGPTSGNLRPLPSTPKPAVRSRKIGGPKGLEAPLKGYHRSGCYNRRVLALNDMELCFCVKRPGELTA
jgi:hypothetical protein